MGVNTHFLWICLVGMLDEMAIREKLATILDVCFVFHFGQLFLQILVTLTSTVPLPLAKMEFVCVVSICKTCFKIH